VRRRDQVPLLGFQDDGYPVTYKDVEYSLEDIVIKHADTYGVPPHYLMSQVTKEAATITKHGETQYNPYSYRYEPYAFDFEFISGDDPDCCSGNQHKLFVQPGPDPDEPTQGFSFLRSGLTAGGAVVYLPAYWAGDTTPVLESHTLSPVGSYPTSEFQIDAFPGPVRWNVDIVDDTHTRTFIRARPGEEPGAGTYRVDCRTGQHRYQVPLSHLLW
jgi:hypothetical protein